MIGYHKGDRSYAFLNSSRIGDFDELNELFFEVLAVRVNDRSESVRSKFGAIPYLNSSLFEESDLERATVRINELKNRLDLPLHGATVLKAANGKRLTGSKSTLGYLFEFLDAYDFGAEGSAEIQEQNKSIINASVLGLIFEKINGYKDGSFFTPGFITMYICRETIRRAVVQKFNDRYGWNCTNTTELHNDLYRQRIPLNEANALVNSLKICDPAVGSGHFLVSALNEIIAVKSELRILADSDGKLLRCDVTIENDELIVTTDDQIFEYNFKDAESQRIQETLFHEKEIIIENCLFGVDINPKSVAICRLRLWIELLKNAYYRQPPLPTSPHWGEEKDSLTQRGRVREGAQQLETLPNIDINIKCGNSLVSRFALGGTTNMPAVSRNKLKELTEKYRRHVFEYKLSPANKAQLRKVIDGLKHDLENFGLPNDKDLIALRKKENEVAQLGFAFDKKGTEVRQELLAEVEVLSLRFAEKERLVYSNDFEWRFEFPEVLDEEGEFAGFDAIIGNPPYIRQEAIKEQKPAFLEMFDTFYCGTANIYTYFYKTGLNLLKSGATLCYIAPNKFMRAGYGKNTRELLTTQARPLMVLDFGDLPIFDEATTYPSIVMVEKCIPSPPPSPSGRGSKKANQTNPRPPGEGERRPGERDFFTATFTDSEQLTRFDETLATIGFTMPIAALRSEGWALERPDVLALMDKLRSAGKSLGEYVEGKFYRDVLTGLNEAFVIDEEARQRLIAEDPKSAEIIKPWLRGLDIRKWQAEWAGLYIIAIASSGNREWPWSQEKTEATARPIFEQTYPAVHKHLTQWETGLRKRDDKGRFWWELRACVYYESFLAPKIMYPDIAQHSKFLLDESGSFSSNTTYFIPSSDYCLLGLLNSKLLWWFYGTITSSIQGGFVRYFSQYMEHLPILPATDTRKPPSSSASRKSLPPPTAPTYHSLKLRSTASFMNSMA